MRINRMTVRVVAGTDPARAGRAAAAEVAQALSDQRGHIDSIAVSVAPGESVGPAVAEAVRRRQSGEEPRR